MKLSDYIELLEAILEEHGDLEVQTDSFSSRREALEPKIAYTLILRGRELVPRFWQKYADEEDRKVIRSVEYN